MTNHTTADTTTHIPYPRVDSAAIATRLGLLAEAGACPHCGPALSGARTDIADLLIEVTRLYAAVLATCRESANRLAAIRAALGAERDGEVDPLEYLRDELTQSPGVALSDRARGWWV